MIQQSRALSPRAHEYLQVLKLVPFILLCIPIEVMCVNFAWETAGEVMSGFLVFILLLGNFVVFGSMLFRSRRLTLALFILFLLVTIPYPVIWKIRLDALDAEARRIIAFVDNHRAATGADPASLAGYTFQRPKLATYFSYTPGYQLNWWAVQPGVSHWYTPDGGFAYYPD